MKAWNTIFQTFFFFNSRQLRTFYSHIEIADNDKGNLCGEGEEEVTERKKKKLGAWMCEKNYEPSLILWRKQQTNQGALTNSFHLHFFFAIFSTSFSQTLFFSIVSFRRKSSSRMPEQMPRNSSMPSTTLVSLFFHSLSLSLRTI